MPPELLCLRQPLTFSLSLCFSVVFTVLLLFVVRNHWVATVRPHCCVHARLTTSTSKRRCLPSTLLNGIVLFLSFFLFLLYFFSRSHTLSLSLCLSLSIFLGSLSPPTLSFMLRSSRDSINYFAVPRPLRPTPA